MDARSLLLFDLGGVLIKSAVFEKLNDLLPEPMALAELKHRWLFTSAVRDFERGEIAADQFAAAFIDQWQLAISVEQFLGDFKRWPREYFPGARELIRELRSNHRVGCLSNSNIIHSEYVDDIVDDLDIALFSHQLGAIKPDAEIFELALQHCDQDARSIYFFDDCQANVESARRFGIQAFQVDGFDALLECLHEQGLLTTASTA